MLLAVIERRAGLGRRRATTCTSPRSAALASPSRAPTSLSPWRSSAPSTTSRSRRDVVVLGEVGLGGEVRQVRPDAAPARRGGAPRLPPRHRPGTCASTSTASALPVPTLDAAPRCRPRRLTARGLDHASVDSDHAGPLWLVNDELREALSKVAPGTPLRAGIERIVAGQGRRPLVVNDDPEVLAICSRRLPRRRPVQPAAPVRAGQDGRRDHPVVELRPHRPGQRPPRPRPHGADQRDRHPPSHRRAGRPLAEGAGRLGERGDGRHQPLRRWLPSTSCRTSAGCSTGPTRRCRRSSATRCDSRTPCSTSPRPSSRTPRRCATSPPSCQRGEMVNRIAEEIETMIIELGIDARLLRLQLDEIYGDIDDELELVVADYLPAGPHGRRHPGRDGDAVRRRGARPAHRRRHVATRRRSRTTSTRTSRPRACACSTGCTGCPTTRRRGSPTTSAGCSRLQRATVPDLMAVDGVDDITAASIKETLQRVTEIDDPRPVLLRPRNRRLRWPPVCQDANRLELS